jgi:hypothetical protein
VTVGCSGVEPMVKEKKFFRKQANKAEQAAGRTSDPERAAGLRALATAFRTQADMLKRKQSKTKGREPSCGSEA